MSPSKQQNIVQVELDMEDLKNFTTIRIKLRLSVAELKILRKSSAHQGFSLDEAITRIVRNKTVGAIQRMVEIGETSVVVDKEF